MHNIFLRPARDAAGQAKRVPDEFGGALPESGAHKPRSQYWLRRLADGDVIEGPPPAAAKRAEGPKEIKPAPVKPASVKSTVPPAAPAPAKS